MGLRTCYSPVLHYFAEKETLTAEDFICGAHMVYGWMPTIFTLGPAGALTPADAAKLVDKARRDGALTDAKLRSLSTATNNSLVGASKLLHFAAPESFAIWDSKVHRFVFQEAAHQSRMKDIARYRTYQIVLDRLQRSPRFSDFHKIVNQKLRYSVSPLRALELVMFLRAGME